jgi:hypothetical protein
MNDTQASAAVTAEAIETALGGRWGVWLSGTGRWWATRREKPSASGLDAAGVLLVRADDPDQLRTRIREQEALSERTHPALLPGR